MVEKIVVAPNEVRGYGNIVDNDKDKSDLCFYNSFVNADTDLIDGIRIGIMRMIYQDPNLFFSFHQLEKYLYVNSDDMTLSFDSNNKRLVFDDTTESFSLGFDSTNKVLYIGETGEHNYSIAFSQSSYTASGGSATLEITLLDSNVPVQSASVTVTGSDSSSYTGLTNSSGIATVTVSNISADTTFTASYSNVTDTCTVIPSNIIYSSTLTSDDGNWSKSGKDCSVTYSSNGLKVQGTSTAGDAFYKLDETKVPIPHTNIIAEYTVVAINTGDYAESTEFIVGNMDVEMNNLSLKILDRATGNSLYTGTMPSRPFNVKVEINTTQAKCYINDTLRATTNINWQYVGFKTYNNRTITIKDLEITPLS